MTQPTDQATDAPSTADPASPVVTVFDTVSSRRSFLQRASLLSLAIPAGGLVLAACANDHKPLPASQDTTPPQHPQGTSHNPDSKLDSSLHAPAREATRAGAGAVAAPYARFDPLLPPLSASRTVQLDWTARAVPIRISDDTVVAGWTFEGNTPGPIVHCRVGDTVSITLHNDEVMPHSIDFHAAQIDPRTAFRSVSKGQTVTFSYKPRYAGAFLYHCGTAPVLMHLGSGMYGAIVVSPAEPLPPAREFVLVEAEMYLGAAINGVRPFDYNKMLTDLPDVVTFNGRPDQYVREPIHVKVGERVRFWVVNAGPTHPCAFHVVGEQFDTVYLGSPPGNAIHGVQTFSVAAGGGMCFELMCDVPGEFPFVNHSFGHGQKGAIGYLVVDG
jgi:nitrite reductase (NO-forming)